MRTAFPALLFWTLVLCACSTSTASPQPAPSSLAETPSALPATVATPQDCGYQWANQDLPELSNSFQQSIQALQPGAQANAYAFGENCIRADGSIAGFSAAETDFNVKVQVDDLANESVLGRWIVQVMQIIEGFPSDQIAGPRPGRVSIVFQSSTAQRVINFYINQYQDLPPNLSHLEVYQALQALQ